MGEQLQVSRKWEGQVRVELKNSTPKQIWPLISDFCSLHKWFPHVKTCYLVEGVLGKPGMIRYCGTTELPGGGTQWAKEKLLIIDSSQMCFTFEILDNNAGFKNYVTTTRLVPIDRGNGVRGCMFVWSFVADPVEGFTYESLFGFFESAAQAMAKRMEEALLQ